MKKFLRKLFTTWYFYSILITIVVFVLLSRLVIIGTLDRCDKDITALYEQQKVIQTDFEKVYDQDNYSISTKNNLILVKLSKNNCSVICYFTQQKEFVYSELKTPPLYTSNAALIFCWIAMAVVSFLISIIITAFAGLIISNVKRRH